MGSVKDDLLRVIQARAEEEARALASEFARAASEEREAILAELEFDQWLTDSCRSCSQGDQAAHQAKRHRPRR